MSDMNLEPRPPSQNRAEVNPSPSPAPAAPAANPEQEVEDEEPLIIRTRRRRPRNNPPSPTMSPLVENSEEEGRGEEMVLLFPRLVLDRIRVTPSRRVSEDPGPPEPVETPRSRESFEDFTRQMGGLDPLEGPSWLFNDNPGPSSRSSGAPRPTKSREERRQENSVKARVSGASRKLSLESNEEPEIESEPIEDEPRRRGGSRAAAKAARSALKEQPMNVKLRQGDPGAGSSVYDDFVPGTKRKSERKSSKSSGSKKKKSSEK